MKFFGRKQQQKPIERIENCFVCGQKVPRARLINTLELQFMDCLLSVQNAQREATQMGRELKIEEYRKSNIRAEFIFQVENLRTRYGSDNIGNFSDHDIGWLMSLWYLLISDASLDNKLLTDAPVEFRAEIRSLIEKRMRIEDFVVESKKLAKTERYNEYSYMKDLRKELSSEHSQFIQSFVDWLENHGPDPDLWHDIATNSDPDGKDEVFLWIIRQKQCDAATAAMIFHAAGTYDLFDLIRSDKKFPTLYRGRMQIAAEVCRRWKNDDFLTNKFHFFDNDADCDYEYYLKIADEVRDRYCVVPFEVERGLFEYHSGEKTKTEYYFSDFDSLDSMLGVAKAG